MMRQLAAGGGMPGHAGHPGDGSRRQEGQGQGRPRPARSGKGGRSGNPAKRAQEQRRREPPASPARALPDLPEDFELPDELKDLLPPGAR